MPENPPHVRTLKTSALVHRPFFRAAAIAIALGLVVFMRVHRFLAVSRPTGEGILVVEGWIPIESLRDAGHLFQGGSYRYLVVVGGPLEASDAVAKDRIVKIALPPTSADRTFAMAKAFKQWSLSSGETICCVDVYTVGVHARKSWITFQSVLGGTCKTGVIAGPELSYNPDYWLVSPRGLWLVVRNLTGYLHSRCRILLRTA